MAQRFGGKFSPDGTGPSDPDRPAFDGARVDPVGARSNLLFLPPILLAFTSLTAGAAGLAVGLLGATSLTLGAWLLRDGLRAEAEYAARRVARRPALPRKIFAAALAGIGAALATFNSDASLAAPVIYGIAAGALHLAAFGIDPLGDKQMEGVDTFQQNRVARVVDEAEKYLAAMTEAATRSGDRQVAARVERFQIRARELLRTVEEDPRDLTAARKFLGVYLMGARDASQKFADVYVRTRDAKARSDYMLLLSDLEETFGAKTKTLLLDTNSDLNVEIEVLRDRLQREGVRLG
ncbi:hypothetical protein P775_10920 [Puniceibacterium antarcticum]|uniref:5-bromo-4-chloroindolyl phosphate hydrolysis protein n=1 Tax=Puniceibacterium antarcticum TaxID=1206336 RepID=A0A2G8RFB1_9RHOB|nr:5-bromo-4-chloroindolyl phosphate hydrolysis family protein [Puniceibacterium antarcticum]PIL20173.1 hypothetical protein P775_10920 [Puniceibacterium antarcticum]